MNKNNINFKNLFCFFIAVCIFNYGFSFSLVCVYISKTLLAPSQFLAVSLSLTSIYASQVASQHKNTYVKYVPHRRDCFEWQRLCQGLQEIEISKHNE